MKILAISVRIPEEGKKGEQVLSFHRLSFLAKRHAIHLICFGVPDQDAAAVSRLEALGIVVQLIHWNMFEAGMNVLLSVANHSEPFQCALFNSKLFRHAVECILTTWQPDAVYAVMVRVLGNLNIYRGPLFVDMVDSMGLNFSRRVTMEHGLKRYAFEMECKRVSAYEIYVAHRASCSFVVSAVDQQFIGSDRVRVLPLGINCQQFFRQSDGSSDLVIVFTGNMNYKPNVDAVLWFYSKCWNALKEAVPGVRWVIAGSNPTSDVEVLRSDQAITVTGRVPSLAAVINASRVSIAPMQSGSGMQFKILEAMACGVPVVATSLGLGDIGAERDRDVLLADTPESFVQAVQTLLYSYELSERIGNAGLRYVNANHTWDTLNAEFEKSTIATIGNRNIC